MISVHNKHNYLGSRLYTIDRDERKFYIRISYVNKISIRKRNNKKNIVNEVDIIITSSYFSFNKTLDIKKHRQRI